MPTLEDTEATKSSDTKASKQRRRLHYFVGVLVVPVTLVLLVLAVAFFTGRWDWLNNGKWGAAIPLLIGATAVGIAPRRGETHRALADSLSCKGHKTCHSPDLISIVRAVIPIRKRLHLIPNSKTASTYRSRQGFLSLPARALGLLPPDQALIQ